MSAGDAGALDATTLDSDEQGLVDRVAARRDELVELACRLIAFDTTSRSRAEDPPRDEAALQSLLADRLRARGGGKSLLLNGHIDVVPARREDGWEHDPFDPQIADGRIVGRGACDMKGGIAAMVLAAEVLAETGAVNAIDKGRFLLDGVDRLRREWQSRADLKHPLLDPPDIVVTSFVADAGWHVTIPDRTTLEMSVLILPRQADAQGWTSDAQAEVEDHLRRWCETDSWLAEHPPTFRWHTELNPSDTPVDTPSVRALLGANAALGLPVKLGGLGSWYDGATFALETGTPALMYGPSYRLGAHGRRVRADRRSRRLRPGHRGRGLEAQSLMARRTD
jgi:acetylornithine deacetylase/succinyl-diaminopimelate desuccinylase-like protein